MSRRGVTLKRLAFTLIEMVIVVLLIGILSAAAAPKFVRHLRRAQADAAARRVKADLELARQTAMSRSATQSVQFTAGSSIYTLPGISDPDHPSQTYAVELSMDAYKATITSASFGAVSTVTFDRYGQPNAAGVVEVSAAGFVKTVTVEATNGSVSIP